MKPLRVVAALAAALYALVVETSALRHHGVACSPKAAPSQCETCARGPEVSRVEAGFNLDRPPLSVVGDVAISLDALPRPASTVAHAGRAPPA